MLCLSVYRAPTLFSCKCNKHVKINVYVKISRLTRPEKAVLCFFADSSKKKGFQPDKNPYFCIGQQKKKLLKKNQSYKLLFWDM